MRLALSIKDVSKVNKILPRDKRMDVIHLCHDNKIYIDLSFGSQFIKTKKWAELKSILTQRRKPRLHQNCTQLSR